MAGVLLERMPSAKNFLLIEMQKAFKNMCKNSCYEEAALAIFKEIIAFKSIALQSNLFESFSEIYKSLVEDAEARKEKLEL